MRNLNHRTLLQAGVASTLAMLVLFSAPGCKHEPMEVPFVDTDTGSSGPQPLVDDSVWLTSQPPINSAPCDPGTVYFQNTVYPILFTYCATAGCHDGYSFDDDDPPEPIFPLTSYDTIMTVVVPNEPNNSDLWHRGINETGNDAMPPADHPQLTPGQEQAIFNWIQQGASNNGCNTCDTTVVTYNAHIKPIFQNKCTGCHGGNNSNDGLPAGGLDLTQWSTCNSIALTNALEGSIKHLGSYSDMPPYPDGSYLPACDILKLMKWKREGAPNN